VFFGGARERVEEGRQLTGGSGLEKKKWTQFGCGGGAGGARRETASKFYREPGNRVQKTFKVDGQGNRVEDKRR